MQQNDFEQNIRNKMEGLQMQTPESVWEEIEKNLPKRKKRRGIIFFFLLVGLLTAGVFMYTNNSGEKQSVDPIETATIADKEQKKVDGLKPEVANENDGELIKQKTEKEDLREEKEKAASEDKRTESMIKNESKLITASIVRKEDKGKRIREDKKEVEVAADKKPAADADIKLDSVTWKTKKKDEKIKRQVAKTDLPEAHEETKGMKNSPAVRLTENIANENITFADSTKTVMAHAEQSEPKEIIFEKIPFKTEQSTDKDTNVEEKQNKVVLAPATKNAAVYNFVLSVGRSRISDKVFSENKSLADNTNFNSGGGGSGIFPAGESSKKPGTAFTIGVQREKTLSNRWSYATGLQYRYNSSSVLTGNVIDSAASFFYPNGTIRTNSSRQAGNTDKYTNHYHFIEIPLYVKYKLGQSSPFTLSTGLNYSFLANSNALVYNNSQRRYFSNQQVYNRSSLSFTLGAEALLNREKQFPFSLGMLFTGGLSSVSKKKYDTQYPNQTSIFLQFPVRKKKIK